MEINEYHIDRFISRIKFFDIDRCWEWGSYKSQLGYGKFAIGKKKFLAHRLSFLISRGEIPNGVSVCHSCDNPSCVNPDHLFLGSHSDNMRDMYTKRRDYHSKKTHCKNGHEYAGDNIRQYKGLRRCMICRRKQRMDFYYKNKI